MSTSLLLYPTSEIIELKRASKVAARSIIFDGTPVEFFEVVVRVGELECHYPFVETKFFEGELKFRLHLFSEHPAETNRFFCLKSETGMLLVGILNVDTSSFERLLDAAWKGQGLRLNFSLERNEYLLEWRDGGRLKVGFDAFGSNNFIGIVDWQLSFYFGS